MGNWSEDQFGSQACDRNASTELRMGKSMYASTFLESAKMPPIPQDPPTQASDVVPSALLIPHANTYAQLATRKDPVGRFTTMTGATMMKITTDSVLDYKIDKPADLERNELIRKKAAMRIAGVESWDIDSVQPKIVIPKTVTPVPSLVEAAKSAPASAAPTNCTASHASLSDTIAARSLMPETTIRGTFEHARNTSFTQEFNRGIR